MIVWGAKTSISVGFCLRISRTIRSLKYNKSPYSTLRQQHVIIHIIKCLTSHNIYFRTDPPLNLPIFRKQQQNHSNARSVVTFGYKTHTNSQLSV